MLIMQIVYHADLQQMHLKLLQKRQLKKQHKQQLVI